MKNNMITSISTVETNHNIENSSWVKLITQTWNTEEEEKMTFLKKMWTSFVELNNSYAAITY